MIKKSHHIIFRISDSPFLLFCPHAMSRHQGKSVQTSSMSIVNSGSVIILIAKLRANKVRKSVLSLHVSRTGVLVLLCVKPKQFTPKPSVPIMEII